VKSPTDPIGTQNRDLPACSAVLQPTAPLRVLYVLQDGATKVGERLLARCKSHAACHVIVCQSETAESDGGTFGTEQLQNTEAHAH
jgi:hypothetical protein